MGRPGPLKAAKPDPFIYHDEWATQQMNLGPFNGTDSPPIAYHDGPLTYEQPWPFCWYGRTAHSVLIWAA